MKMKTGKFYVTTPIYYINYTPSVGSAYTTIIADILARWHRLRGDRVFYLTGLDENSVKTVQAARDRGIKNIQVYADSMAKKWIDVWETLKISNNGFIRTTEERHKKVVSEFFMKVFNKGDIYKGKYEGLYCDGCEAFLTESDLVDGRCPAHKKPPKKISEDNYFFRLSRYQGKILEHIKKNPDFVKPKSRRNEIVSFISAGLQDVSISRPDLIWGITLPTDKNHRFWVWFDALVNYISGVPEGEWPADLHIIGKDILRFHCAIWPGMLLSAGYKLPKTIFAHGFFTVNGQKMSKSLGNVIDPVYLTKKYSVDAVRYFLTREIPFGEDGDFSVVSLVTRNNNELADTLGNFINRVLSFVYNKSDKKVPQPRNYDDLDKQLVEKMKTYTDKAGKLMEDLQLHEALDRIMKLAKFGNEYFQAKKPWEGESSNCLYLGANLVRSLAVLLEPFIPESAEIVWKFLNLGGSVHRQSWDSAKDLLLKPGHVIGKPSPLFRKFELDEEPGPGEGKTPELNIVVDKRVENLGLKARGAVIQGVSVKRKHSGLEKLKKKAVEGFSVDKKIIEGYRRIYQKMSMPDIKNPIENLHGIIKKSGKLPTINTVVDSYNVVAARRSLSVGAHDLNKIEGDTVRFRITDGSEFYIPLGSGKRAKINSGEFAVVDDKHVLCRLDIKQGEHTKITPGTRSVFIYVQGNENTTDGYLLEALKEICGNITRFCGGKCTILD